MVVIGAGLSGLAAADSLKTHDPSLQVIVLEASDRVGGRTVSGTIGDKSFDLGGQWILPEHKPLLQVMPCPFTGPKMFCASSNFLCRTKNLFTYCASHKHFVPEQKMICILLAQISKWSPNFA